MYVRTCIVQINLNIYTSIPVRFSEKRKHLGSHTQLQGFRSLDFRDASYPQSPTKCIKRMREHE